MEVRFDSFETEQCCDYVYIHDGYDEYAPYFVYSGNLTSFLPLIYQSSGPYIFIRFITDGSITARGFTARFKSVIGLSVLLLANFVPSLNWDHITTKNNVANAFQPCTRNFLNLSNVHITAVLS